MEMDTLHSLGVPTDNGIIHNNLCGDPLEGFVEISLNDRVRKIALGQIIMIDEPDQPILRNMYPREVLTELKPRDPKLSRTLYPPFGTPMFVADKELEKWLRGEMQIEARRTTTKARQTATQGPNGSDYRH